MLRKRISIIVENTYGNERLDKVMKVYNSRNSMK